MNEEDSRLYTFLKVIFWFVVAIAIIALVLFTFQNGIYAQQNKTPPAPVPNPVPNPTPTEPVPNFQYLPQKAAVTVYNPEVGIPPLAQPMQTVPTVVSAPAAPTQSGTLGIPGLDLALIAGLVGQFIRTELKNKTVTNIVKKIAGNQVKQIEATEEHLGLTFEQMPQKGNEITNKPNIKQQHIKEIKEEALDTAEKA